MDDLISRQTAIELIHSLYPSTPIMRKNRERWEKKYKPYIECEKALEMLPSAQPDMSEYSDKLWKAAYERGKAEAQPDLDEVYAHAETEAEARYHAEIVRCKDCKHQVKEWRTDKRLKDNGYMVCGCDVVGDACGYWALLGQDDDYCSMAERRTDEGD